MGVTLQSFAATQSKIRFVFCFLLFSFFILSSQSSFCFQCLSQTRPHRWTRPVWRLDIAGLPSSSGSSCLKPPCVSITEHQAWFPFKTGGRSRWLRELLQVKHRGVHLHHSMWGRRKMRNVRRRPREAQWLPNYRTSEWGRMTRRAPSSLAWVKRVMPLWAYTWCSHVSELGNRCLGSANPWADSSSRWQLACNLTRALEPGPPS